MFQTRSASTRALRLLGRALPALALSAPLAASAASDVPLENENQKAIYSYGIGVADNLKFIELSQEEIATFIAGIQDAFADEGRLDEQNPAQAQQRMQNFYREKLQAVLSREDAQSQQYMAEAAGAEGAEKFESGMIMTQVEEGDGESPEASDTVKVHYHGTLRDGTVFDSSVDRGEPAEFPLNRVIPCWTEALQKMKIGGKSTVICPASIAYGDQGRPPLIKPGAALTFEVELIEISEAPPAPPAPEAPSGQ